jgi:predicted ArsR family transcriptional regulator
MLALPDRRPIGRPIGLETRAIELCLSAEPKPARSVAVELGLPTGAVARRLSRMVERGTVSVAELRRYEWASRPLAVYQLAPASTFSLTNTWSRCNG